MNRIYRAYSGARSAFAMLRAWRLMTWHDKMWILWADESFTPPQRQAFADSIVRAAALSLFDQARGKAVSR